jgi:CheY-like chemotaxis protein
VAATPVRQNQRLTASRTQNAVASSCLPYIAQHFTGLTIVVVEDHGDARMGLFLEHLATNVVLARDAFEGIEVVKNSHPNLVLSDIAMPGRDGFALLSDIRALGPQAGGSVPVVAMTALVTRAD